MCIGNSKKSARDFKRINEGENKKQKKEK